MSMLSFLIPSANTLYPSPPLFPKNLPYIPKCTSSLMPNAANTLPHWSSLLIHTATISTSETSWFQRSLFLFIPVSIRPSSSDSFSPISDAIHLFSMATTLGQTTALTLPTGFRPPVPSPPAPLLRPQGVPKCPEAWLSKQWLPTAFHLGLPMIWLKCSFPLYPVTSP